MILLDNVIKKPEFIKEADLKLSKEISKWQDEILDKFYEDVPYLPKEYGVELSIGNVDAKGYAEGAVVVWNRDIAINFPIIIRNYILSPFDIFRTKEDGENEYQPADEDRILNELANNILGVPSKYYPYRTDVEDLKSPGGVQPKRAIYVDTGSTEFIKRSSLIDIDDFNNFKNELSNESIKVAFLENTGDVLKTLYREYDRIARKKKEPINTVINLTNSIVRKEINTIIEDNSMDPGNYQPLEAGSGKIVTLRSKVLPSVRDFIENDPHSLAILHFAKVGSPVHGILLNCYNISSLNSKVLYCNDESYSDDSGPDKEIFISLDGKVYSSSYFSARNISYFGKELNKSFISGLKLISENTTDDFAYVTMDNREDGSDFYHPPIKEFDGGKMNRLRNRGVKSVNSYDINLIVICKNRNGEYSAFRSTGPFKTQIVNGIKVYNNDEVCFVPTKGIKAISQVDKIDGLTFDLAVPDNLKIFVVPFDTIFINTSRMIKRNPSDFLRPEYKIREAINRVKTAELSVNGDGFIIKSECFEPIKKLAGIGDNFRLNVESTIECLNIMGVKKEAAKKAMKYVIAKTASRNYEPVTLIGVHNDYISGTPLKKISNLSEYGKTIEQYVNECLKFNTVKIASLLNDPESVENILNINFITKENLNNFVDSIEEFESVREKLAKMLQSSRMGLKDINEEATKKAMETLGTCVENLRAVKGALGK